MPSVKDAAATPSLRRRCAPAVVKAPWRQRRGRRINGSFVHRIQQPAGASIVAQWRHHRFFWHSRRLPTKWAARTRPSTTSCDAAGPPIGRLGERIQTWKIRVHSEPRASNSRPRPAASRHGLEPDTARGFFVNKAPLLINTNNQNFMTRSTVFFSRFLFKLTFAQESGPT